MSDFSPAQLDALEDALEDLESSGVPPEAGVAGGPDVARRLDDYREILHAAREAMPLQDVKIGLLDGVIAQAHAAARVPAAAEPAAKEAWWKRFRMSLLLPGLAVAGGAALVLLLIRPASDEEAEPALAAQSHAEPMPEELEQPNDEAGRQPAGILEDGLADASVDKDASRGRLRLEEEADRGGAINGFDDAAPPPPAEAPVEIEPEPGEATRQAADPTPSEKIPYDNEYAKGKAKRKASPPAPGGSVPSTPTPTPKSAPKQEAKKSGGGGAAPSSPEGEEKNDDRGYRGDEPKDVADGWATISAADKLRHANNCGSARGSYNGAVKHADAKVRARALAGLGLCALASGEEKTAEAYFTKARKADPGISGFINHERKPLQSEAQSQSAE